MECRSSSPKTQIWGKKVFWFSLSLTLLEMANVGASTHDGFLGFPKSVENTPWPRVNHDEGCKWSRNLD